jgi:hypothetical protein
VLSFSYANTGLLTVTLRGFIDEAGELRNWKLRAFTCRAAPGGAIPTHSFEPEVNTAVFDLSGLSGATKLVFVFHGEDRNASIEDYGGSIIKENSKTEGESPYAAAYLSDFETARGSMYKRNGLLLVENLALARALQCARRLVEQYSCGAVPVLSSGFRLRRWAEWQGVYSSESTEAKLQARCAAHALLLAGGIESSLEKICSLVLGTAFVGLERYAGDPDWDYPSLPAPTNWEENPGAGDMDLGEGVWLSWNGHVKVKVQTIPGLTRDQLESLCQRELAPLLDVALPGTATFSWGRVGGFILGSSRLGIDTL